MRLMAFGKHRYLQLARIFILSAFWKTVGSKRLQSSMSTVLSTKTLIQESSRLGRASRLSRRSRSALRAFQGWVLME
ncbi:MAG: hypothetical protein J3Q66DRAFT_350632 [Benniella sp.]|nr:MAG: hypothetical protein J3Q66DRAFT_350632 [Benniella sp.]